MSQEFGIDLNEVSEMLDDLKKTNQSGSKGKWSPKIGTQIIRIVPYAKNHKNPFVRMYFHYNLSRIPLLSPLTYGEPDPIEEAAQLMFKKARETGDKEDWKLGRKLEKGLRTFVPIVVRDEEHLGVKWWGFGKEIFEELLNTIDSGDYGDITHPINGRDIRVTKKSKEEAGNDYGKVTIRILGKEAKLTEDKELMKKLLTEQPDPEELYEKLSYEDLKAHLKKYLEPEEEGADVDGIEDEIEDIKTPAETKPEEKQSDVVMSEFDDVLSQIESGK